MITNVFVTVFQLLEETWGSLPADSPEGIGGFPPDLFIVHGPEESGHRIPRVVADPSQSQRNLATNLVPAQLKTYEAEVLLTATDTRDGTTVQARGTSLFKAAPRIPERGPRQQVLQDAFTDAAARLTARLMGEIPLPPMTALELRRQWKEKNETADDRGSGQRRRR